jgi:hypothetical protein
MTRNDVLIDLKERLHSKMAQPECLEGGAFKMTKDDVMFNNGLSAAVDVIIGMMKEENYEVQC